MPGEGRVLGGEGRNDADSAATEWQKLRIAFPPPKTRLSALAEPAEVPHLRSRIAWWGWIPQQMLLTKSNFRGLQTNRARVDPISGQGRSTST